MKNIKYLVMDVDGTLTDGKIYMSDSGELCKAFNIKDGYGINGIVVPQGIIPIVMTGRKSKCVVNRCKELGIVDIYQGVENKLEKLMDAVSDLNKVAYIGDDINDLTCMISVKASGGLVGCPADAVQKVKDIANYISKNKGGEGAVRDFIDWLIY